MTVIERLASMLPLGTARRMAELGDALTEVRLRAGRPVQLVWADGDALGPDFIDAGQLRTVLCSLMDYSVYTRQEELDRGFFTLDDGSRVGVCGRMAWEHGRARMAEIGSACARVARPVPGCADTLMEAVLGPAGPRSVLLVSPPGLGKTTLLRDIARQVSQAGHSVAIADERHELAACREGAPTLDVGPRTDVLDGCPRAEAVSRLLRAMAPRLIVTDEIGGKGDARALLDAARCGVAVAASAHGESFEEALSRRRLRPILMSGVIRTVALLGPRPGGIAQLWKRSKDAEGEWVWRRA